MAKKKPAAASKPSVTRKVRPAAAPKKRPPSRKEAKAGRASTKSKGSGKKRAAAAGVSLGRPLVTAEEKLFLLFKDDYEARQVFEFLRCETVADLERFTPQKIVDILSPPVQRTVRRIRERLADKKRCLSGDEAFAVEHLKKLP